MSDYRKLAEEVIAEADERPEWKVDGLDLARALLACDSERAAALERVQKEVGLSRPNAFRLRAILGWGWTRQPMGLQRRKELTEITAILDSALSPPAEGKPCDLGDAGEQWR